MQVDLSIILPSFNEAANLPATVARIDDFLTTEMPDVTYEILVVNDGSSDSTLNVAENIARSTPSLKVHSLPYNQGRGAAMKAGIANARGYYLIFLDADLSYDVDHIKEIYQTFKSSPLIDVVNVSPYKKGGMAQNIPWRRLMVSKLANFILSGFIDDQVTTVTSMCRGYRAQILKNTPLLEDGKELHLEILRKMVIKGAGIREIPGRLIWKEKKLRAKRQAGGKFFKAVRLHLLYGFLAKPARLVKWLAIIFLVLGLYEFVNIFRVFIEQWPKISSGSLQYDLWLALAAAFSKSPHTVVIAVSSTVFAFQASTFYLLFTALDLQHRENVAHMLALYEELKK